MVQNQYSQLPPRNCKQICCRAEGDVTPPLSYNCIKGSSVDIPSDIDMQLCVADESPPPHRKVPLYFENRFTPTPHMSRQCFNKCLFHACIMHPFTCECSVNTINFLPYPDFLRIGAKMLERPFRRYEIFSIANHLSKSFG